MLRVLEAGFLKSGCASVGVLVRASILLSNNDTPSAGSFLGVCPGSLQWQCKMFGDPEATTWRGHLEGERPKEPRCRSFLSDARYEMKGPLR